MIKNFRHKGLRVFFETGSTRGINSQHANKLQRQLSKLDETMKPEGMNMPGWDLHPLQGDLKDHWSVKVSGNWRITFMFENGDPVLVDYQDYH